MEERVWKRCTERDSKSGRGMTRWKSENERSGRVSGRGSGKVRVEE